MWLVIHSSGFQDERIVRILTMSTLLEKDLGKDKSITNYYWLKYFLTVGYYIHHCSSSRISKSIMLHDIIFIQYLTFQKWITFENYNLCILQEHKETCWEKLVELSVITLYSNYIRISMNKNRHVSSLVRGMPGSYSDNRSGAPANNTGSNVHCTTSTSTSRLPKSCGEAATNQPFTILAANIVKCGDPSWNISCWRISEPVTSYVQPPSDW